MYIEFKNNKAFISALLHKPDLIAESVFIDLETENDVIAEKAINLLWESGLIRRNVNYQDWSEHYKVKPPDLKELLSYITSNDRLQETDVRLFEHFPEVIYLKEIYETVPPDENALRMKQSVEGVDHYQLGPEFIPIEKRLYPNPYFNEIELYGRHVTCSNCGIKTFINGQDRFTFSVPPFVKFQYEYQCQDCGKLAMDTKMSESKPQDSLKVACKCGGQFRRDKPLFCPNCLYNKTGEN